MQFVKRVSGKKKKREKNVHRSLLYIAVTEIKGSETFLTLNFDRKKLFPTTTVHRLFHDEWHEIVAAIGENWEII